MNDLNETRQTTVGGNLYGQLLSGCFEGPVNVSSQFNIYLDQVYPRVNYHAEIADLLQFYGDAFVGRKEALDELLTCVTRHEPGYCLVQAPSGYGKTALIVQLIYQHKHNRWPNGKPTLLFHFVRQEGRRNTARDFLRSLNSQLLTTLNLPGGVPTEIEALRAQFINLWTGAVQLADEEHSLTLLVDGLDEMSTLEPTVAQVLPTLLTPYVHVVVTSRQNPAALEQVGIEHPFRQARTIYLQQFGHAEVEELLNLYRDPVSRDAVFIEQLLHLTHGEPLFLRFLCQQVAEWGEKAKDKLTTLPKLKGVEDYFRQQLRQLRSQASGKLTYNILGLLLVAYSGLTINEMSDALEQSKVTVSNAIEPIKRFLLGETRLELMHPEFRRAVNTLFTLQESQRYKRMLLDYARDAWDGDSRYALSHLAQHLRDEGNLEELLGLLGSPQWHHARRRHDLTGFSLVQDVRLACEAAEAGGIAQLPKFITASMLRARLRSQINNLPVEVIEVIGRLGRCEQAVAWANLVFSQARRATALWRLGQQHLETDSVETGVDLLKQAREDILALEKDELRPYHLARLASHFYYQAGRSDEAQQSLNTAFELVDSESDEANRGLALVALVRGMYDYGAAELRIWLGKAERTTRQIERILSYRALALARIAEQLYRVDARGARELTREALAILHDAPASYGGEGIAGIVNSQRGRFLAVTIGIAAHVGIEAEALESLDTIEGKKHRSEAYAALGEACASKQQAEIEKAKGYLQQALDIVEKELGGADRDSARLQLINQFLKISVPQAQQIARHIQAQDRRVDAFCVIAEHLSRSGKVETARAWLDEMKVEWGQAFGKVSIAVGQIKSDPDTALEEVEEALQSARQIREGIVGIRQSAYALIGICLRELADAKPKQTREILGQVVADLQSTVGRHSLEITGITQARNDALVHLTEVVAEYGNYIGGARIADGITYDYWRDFGLLSCIQAACMAKDWDTSDQLLSEMTSACGRLAAEITLKGWRTEETESINRVLEGIDDSIAQACHGLSHPTDVLAHVAPALGVAGHISVAQALWTKIKDPIARQESQVELVRLLSQACQVEDAGALVDDIEYSSLKAEATAYVARSYRSTHLSHAQTLTDQALNILNPHGIPPKHWVTRGWHIDEALATVAGTIARWNLSEADEIVDKWIEKEDNRLKARGEIVTAMSASDPHLAYDRLKGIITQGADQGLAGFWRSLAVCSEALVRLVGTDGIEDVYQHIVLIEQGSRWWS